MAHTPKYTAEERVDAVIPSANEGGGNSNYTIELLEMMQASTSSEIAGCLPAQENQTVGCHTTWGRKRISETSRSIIKHRVLEGAWSIYRSIPPQYLHFDKSRKL
ncbi:hypothetical protein PLEOSDRAFT_1081492 [Pleurotus ostreatus PC15]|uniref:Uncharacterized protein n=1 Tax=Pleurotus ostreatus (strain PC15) TaxID=1137138 RepID=A0A067P790_PLEO1|nr:hypothetical protein PLEOSDRAFT_1081492 [Pleurotus ostreatus PC15]